jgi:hypothetical protein
LPTHVKTCYLYIMSSKRLVNVRLDEERLRKAKALRKKGLALSEIVRAAIDQRYEQALSEGRPRDVGAIFARLDDHFPLAAKDLPPLEHDVHDRRQAAAAIHKRFDKRGWRRRGR